MLSLKNIALSFGDQAILTGVDDEFKTGLTFLCGQNGSGKTSLLNIIAGDIQADRGTVMFNNDSVDKQKVAYCRQFMADTFFTGSVSEEIDYTLSYSGSLYTQSEVWQNLEKLGLNRELVSAKSPFQLNITEQKMLSLVLAIVKPYDLLLLDETDSGLAFGYKKRVADFLCAIQDQIIIVISHDLWFINYLNAPVLYLSKGTGGQRYPNGNLYLQSLGLEPEQYSLITHKEQIISNLTNQQ